MSDSNDWKAAAIESSNRILDMALELNQLKAENARSTEREIHQLAEIEELRKDAERYRWLRRNNIFAHVRVEQPDGTQPYVYDSELDRSVDEIMTAMRKEQKD